MLRAFAFLLPALAASTPAVAQPFDDSALLRQLGVVAGQAIACGLETPDAAELVMRRTADAWGYGDAELFEVLAEAQRGSRAEGCRPVSPAQSLERQQIWSALKRKANVD